MFALLVGNMIALDISAFQNIFHNQLFSRRNFILSFIVSQNKNLEDRFNQFVKGNHIPH